MAKAKKTKTELTPAKWMRLVEEKLYKEQAELIEKEYDKQHAEVANYGWGVSGDKKCLDVATKVYDEENPAILQSVVEYPSLEIDHEFEPYG